MGPLALPFCVQLCRVARRPVKCRTVLPLSLVAGGLSRWSQQNKYQEGAGATLRLIQCALESGAFLCLSKVKMTEFIDAHLRIMSFFINWLPEQIKNAMLTLKN